MRSLLINIIKSIGYHFNDVENRRTPISMIKDDAVADSYAFIKERLSDAVLFSNTMDLRRFAIDHVLKSDYNDKLFLEFGVFRGRTLRLFADRLSADGAVEPIYGFDAFEGLEEGWSHANYPAGQFNLDGKMPKTRKNARLIKGWVQDTLEEFLQSQSEKTIAFMHLDMDTYSPTRFVLEKTRSRCESGTVMLFDELYGYPNWREHEYRALGEIYDESEYEFLAFGKLQSAIMLK